jgi:hypothetical protein
MPEISRFFGITIAMYYNDHVPPHSHGRYGNQKAIIAIDTLTVLQGKLSPRVLGLVMKWRLCINKSCLKIGNWRSSRPR